MQGRCEVQYVPQCYNNVPAKSLDKQTIWNYLHYYCLLNLTLQWRRKFWRNMILSVKVVGQSCGCQTAPGDQCWYYGLLVWRRVVRQTRHRILTDRNWKRTRLGGGGAGAICIDSSAGFRGVRSTRCKVTLNTVAYITALCRFTRNSSVVTLTVSFWLLLMYLPRKYTGLGNETGKKIRGGWAHCSRVGRLGTSLSPSVAPTI